MRWILPLLFVATVAISVGCENESSSPSAATPTVDLGPACTNDATVEAIYARNRASDGRSIIPAYDEVECRLTRGLIRPSDLGADWQVSRSEAWLTVNGGFRNCYVPLPGIVAVVRDEMSPTGEGLAVVDSTVALLRPGAAENLFQAFEKNCDLFKQEEQWTWTRLPGLGDDAIKVSIWVEESVDRPALETIHVRKGSVISSTTIIDAKQSGLDMGAIQSSIAQRLDDLPPLPEPTPSAGTGCTSDPAEDAPNDEKLERGLLGLDDLPRGWVEDVPGECGFVTTGFFCENERTYPEASGAAMRSFVTAKFAGASGFAQYVMRFKNKDADEYMLVIAAANAEERECTALYEGEQFRWHYEPVTVSSIDGDVEAFGVYSIGADVNTAYCVAHAARGRLVTAIVHVPSARDRREPPGVDCGDDFEEIVKAAIEKLALADD
jgi:hypothetical protein